MEDKVFNFLKRFFPSTSSIPVTTYATFLEILQKVLSHARRYNKTFALLIVDIDHFRDINDNFGALTAKDVIEIIEKRLIRTLRQEDAIAHYSYDKFIILLNGIPHSKYAGIAADKILIACNEPIITSKVTINLTVSIGIGIYPNDGITMEDLKNNADVALLRAKSLGGNNYKYRDPNLDLNAREYNKRIRQLAEAIANKHLELYFQPQLCIKDKTIVRVEALVRWKHPELGVIQPQNFVLLAEESGLILTLGEWILKEACRIGREWIDEHRTPISIAVNVSAKQFSQQDIPNLVKLVLSETGYPPHLLELEITETAIMEDVDTAIVKLTQLAQMGVRIAIDDFGVGYTSISYLKKFPIDVLKVDQLFVHNITTDKNDYGIVSALIGLGHNLDMEVIAEGVETIAQLEVLQSLNCDCVQGTYISAPLPKEKLEERFLPVNNLKTP